MSIITCWSAKAGSGTTVTAAAIALTANRPTVLVDLDGELPIVLGLPEPAGQGLAEWFSSAAPPGAIVDLAVHVDDGVRLVPMGTDRPARDSPRWPVLAAWMADQSATFVLDAGAGAPPRSLTASSCDRDGDRPGGGRVRDLLVTTTCYLATRRAHAIAVRPAGIVLIDRHDDSVSDGDLVRSLGAPIVAKLSLDPEVSCAVNAGLLERDLPKSLRRGLRSLRRAAV